MSNYFDHLLSLGNIAILIYVDPPIITDRVAWSVGRSVTVVMPAKTAKLLRTHWHHLANTNYVLGGGSDAPWKGQF